MRRLKRSWQGRNNMAFRTPQVSAERNDAGKSGTSITFGNDSERRAEESAESYRKQESKFRRSIAILGIVSILILLAVTLLPTELFKQYSPINNPSEFIAQLMRNVRDFFATLAGTGTGGSFVMVIGRYTTAFVAGAALGICGAVYQGSFRNPLASPSTLGVVSGCEMGAVVFFLLLSPDLLSASTGNISQVADALAGMNPLEYIWAIYGRAICAVIGGLVVVGTALVCSRLMGNGNVSNVILVVIGQVFTLTIASVVDTVRYYFTRSGHIDLANLVQMAESSPFDSVLNFRDLAFVCVPVIIGIVILLAMRTRINVLSFGDDEARSLGVDVDRLRTGVVVLCTTLTGITVGFCGPVVFVGFVSPHIARKVVGSDSRFLIPASMFIGAIFLALALCVTNQFDIDMQQGVNLITSVIGCIAFLAVAFANKGGAHAWK